MQKRDYEKLSREDLILINILKDEYIEMLKEVKSHLECQLESYTKAYI